MENWQKIATEMFYKFRAEAEKYNPENEDIKELSFINAGKAIALSELLERFGSKPKV